MRYLPLGPDGPIVSQLGFGTGRLNGDLSARKSARLVCSVRELGITYFDTAPSYGLGDAERILGATLEGDDQVVIATKVGLQWTRPPKWKRTALSARSLAAAQVRRSPLTRGVASPAATCPSPPDQFSPSRDQLMRSVDASLRNLRRSCLDVLLLHDVHPARVNDSTISALEELVSTATIRAWGFGINAFMRNACEGSALWQTRWPSTPESDADAPATIYHGILRDSLRDGVQSPVQCLLSATASRPGSVFLVSSNTRGHVESLVGALG